MWMCRNHEFVIHHFLWKNCNSTPKYAKHQQQQYQHRQNQQQYFMWCHFFLFVDFFFIFILFNEPKIWFHHNVNNVLHVMWFFRNIFYHLWLVKCVWYATGARFRNFFFFFISSSAFFLATLLKWTNCTNINTSPTQRHETDRILRISQCKRCT